MRLAFNLPINSVSFGQISVMLLRSLFDAEKTGRISNLDTFIFPIGNSDLSAQKVDKEFVQWLQNKTSYSLQNYSRDIPVFKIWHLNGSLESFGTKQTLLSFYELDNPTKVEINIAKNNNLCFSSKYTCDIFKLFGAKSNFIPLAFDSYNFSKVEKKFNDDGRIVFNLCGKLEKRKHHQKIITTWIKKFGNQRKYALQCATFNPFLNEQQNNEIISQILQGNKPFNVSFYPFMQENSVYNDFLNSSDIILGMSGAEGWGLPEFNSVCLGKHAVLLNAHAYKSWATEEIASLVNPTGKIPAVDNIFFKNGGSFNQGNIFDWNEDEFISSCENAISKVETTNRINKKGLELQNTFSKEIFLDNIITNSI
jgi:hypothetical protein